MGYALFFSYSMHALVILLMFCQELTKSINITLRLGWERCVIAFACTCICHVKNVVCCYVWYATCIKFSMFSIRPFSTYFIIICAIAFMKCSACLYSTLNSIFFLVVRFSYFAVLKPYKVRAKLSKVF